MPLGILSDDEFNRELESQLAPSQINALIKTPESGRRNGDLGHSDSVQKVIAGLAIEGERSKDIQEAFGVSASSVSAYKSGATSTKSLNEGKLDEKLTSHRNIVRDNLVRRAQNKLGRALNAITPEKLDALDAKEASSVAKDMSAVIKNLEPPKEAVDPNVNVGVQFVMFAPKMRKEEEFDVVPVED